MYQVIEVPIQYEAKVSLELPVNSIFSGVVIKDKSAPYVSVCVPTEPLATELVELRIVRAGEIFGSELIGHHPEFIGSVQMMARRKRENGVGEDGSEYEILTHNLYVYVIRKR